MRSPWLRGTVGLAWLAAASMFASGPVSILALWAVGLVAGIVYLSRSEAPEHVESQPPGLIAPPTTSPVTNDMVPLRVMTAEDIATLLTIDIAVVIAAIQAGELPGNQLAGEWRCSEESLRRWLDGSWH